MLPSPAALFILGNASSTVFFCEKTAVWHHSCSCYHTVSCRSHKEGEREVFLCLWVSFCSFWAVSAAQAIACRDWGLLILLCVLWGTGVRDLLPAPRILVRKQFSPLLLEVNWNQTAHFLSFVKSNTTSSEQLPWPQRRVICLFPHSTFVRSWKYLFSLLAYCPGQTRAVSGGTGPWLAGWLASPFTLSVPGT